jgi:hypothetical protein
MAEIDPKVRRIRRIGVAGFLAAVAVSVPLGMHIHETSSSPELGLTLLGAVLLLVLISLFALETAAAPIPEPRYTEEDAAGIDLDQTEMIAPEIRQTEVVEPDPDLAELATEMNLEDHRPSNPDGPMLVVPNPALAHAETRLSDTEIDEDEPA